MYRLKDSKKLWIGYELDGQGSSLPAPVALEIVNRKESCVKDGKIVCGSMVFNANDFKDAQ